MNPKDNDQTEGKTDCKDFKDEKIELNEVNNNIDANYPAPEANYPAPEANYPTQETIYTKPETISPKPDTLPNNNLVTTHIDAIDINEKNIEQKGLNYPLKNPQNGVMFKIPEQLFRRYLLISYIYLLIQYGLISLIIWLESRLRINDKFRMFLWITLGIIFGISLAGIIMAIFVIHRCKESNFGKCKFFTYLIFNIIFICIYCIALNHYIDYKYILWLLYSIDINYAFMVFYLIFLAFRFKVIVPIILILNFIIIIVSYYKFLDTTVSNIIKCALVLLAFVIYNIFAVYFLRAFKIRRDNEEKIAHWNSKFWAMKISYGIYYPISFIFIGIFQLFVICKRSCCDNIRSGTGAGYVGTGPYVGTGGPFVYNSSYHNMDITGCDIACNNCDRGDCQNCGECKDCGDCFGCGGCIDCGECDCGQCECGDCGNCDCGDCGNCDCGDCGNVDCGQCDCGDCGDCGNCDCGDCGNVDCGNCDCGDCGNLDCGGADCGNIDC